MLRVDSSSGDIVLRIIYDGSPRAGKTTNVQTLGRTLALQGRGTLSSPGTTGERTEFFDWLDFPGGYLDGRRVRCQLVSVPGQLERQQRRLFLLETADAMVHVVDATPEGCREAIESYKTTVEVAARIGTEQPIGIVVQANKQDLPGALPPAEVGPLMGLLPLTPVVGSNAASGEGVLETFLLAVRLAMDRARALLSKDFVSPSGSYETPEAIYAQMLAREGSGARRGRLGLSGSDDALLPSEPVIVELAMAVAGESSPWSEARTNRITDASALAIPQAHELAAGHVWPPMAGRSVFAIATGAPLHIPAVLEAWAPPEAQEVVSEAGWVLHTSARWTFATESAARLRLLSMVRSLAGVQELVPKGRALALARDGDRWRLWLATPRLQSLTAALQRALQEDRGASVAPLLEGLAAAFPLLQTYGARGPLVPGGAAGLGLEEGRIVALYLDEGPEVEPTAPIDVFHDLQSLFPAVAGAAAVSEWFVQEGARLFGRWQGPTAWTSA